MKTKFLSFLIVAVLLAPTLTFAQEPIPTNPSNFDTEADYQRWYNQIDENLLNTYGGRNLTPETLNPPSTISIEPEWVDSCNLPVITIDPSSTGDIGANSGYLYRAYQCYDAATNTHRFRAGFAWAGHNGDTLQVFGGATYREKIGGVFAWAVPFNVSGIPDQSGQAVQFEGSWQPTKLMTEYTVTLEFSARQQPCNNGPDAYVSTWPFTTADGSIDITKKDEDGNLIPNWDFDVYVEPKAGEWALLDRVTTGSNGRASSQPLPTGTYKVVDVLKPGSLPVNPVSGEQIVTLTQTNFNQSLIFINHIPKLTFLPLCIKGGCPEQAVEIYINGNLYRIDSYSEDGHPYSMQVVAPGNTIDFKFLSIPRKVELYRGDSQTLYAAWTNPSALHFVTVWQNQADEQHGKLGVNIDYTLHAELQLPDGTTCLYVILIFIDP